VRYPLFLGALGLAVGLLAGCDSDPAPVPPSGGSSAAVASGSGERGVPAGAVKMTPEADAPPPRLHSDGWHAPVPLPAAINTAGAEDSPYVTPDGRTLYFWFTPDVTVPPHKQLIDGFTGIYVIRRQGDGWGKAERIALQEPDKVSLDGAPVVHDHTMWFCSVRRGNFREVDFYIATFRDGAWRDWTNAGKRLNEEFDVGELDVSQDGKTIYFHANRPGGQGQNDIWRTRFVGGTWQDPENVEAVNSAENESQPFIAPDGETMWLTRRHRGTPGVFRSRRKDGRWQPPELVLSQFAGEPTVDAAGTLYFVHHFFKDGKMIEADLYRAERKAGHPPDGETGP